jgi:hypothetical protein
VTVMSRFIRVITSLAILGLDFMTGPYIQVRSSSWSQWAGDLPFFFVWEIPSTWALEAADTAIDVVVLLALIWVIQ